METRKGVVSIWMLVVLGVITVLVGTGILEHIWPVGNISPEARRYAGQDPNLSKTLFTNLTDLKKTKQAIEMEYFVTKTELTAAENKNEGLHTIFAGEVSANLEAGETLYQKAVGTSAAPGWAIVGLGGLLAAVGAKYYSDSTNQAANYTPAEYLAALEGKIWASTTGPPAAPIKPT